MKIPNQKVRLMRTYSNRLRSVLFKPTGWGLQERLRPKPRKDDVLMLSSDDEATFSAQPNLTNCQIALFPRLQLPMQLSQNKVDGSVKFMF